MRIATWLRRCSFVMLLALAAVGCNRIQAQLRPRPAGPNVLFVTIDTLRADHVGAYGAKVAKTPHLDALARRGVLFERAVAPVPLTLPSHTSLHTGLYPPHHGVRHNSIFHVSAELDTLAERFRDAGYRTGAVIAADVLAPEFGLVQGFDDYDADLPLERAAQTGYFERVANEVTDRALAWLRGDDRPFFLWIHYYDPHGNHNPPEPYRSQYARHLYNGEIAFVDAELGRLLDAMQREGRMENTVVAVTSDHGEGLGQHGEPTHSYLIYDSVTLVPLIFAGPGVPSGVRVPGVVSNVGTAATLLALAGVPALPKTDVGDLAPRWRVPSASGDVAYAESLAGSLDYGWSPIHGLRSTAYSYIRAPKPELYDALRDPGQYHNLLTDGSDTAAQVQQQAEAELDRILADEVALERTSVDDETRRRIEALGYVVPTGDIVQNGADPKDVHHLSDLVIGSESFLLAGKDQQAIELGEIALKQIPNSPEVHHTLTLAYSKVGAPERALPHAEAAVRLRPDTGRYVAELAFLQASLGQAEAARKSYAHLEEIGKGDPEAQIVLMGSVRLGGRPEDAAKYARRALELANGRRWVSERVGESWEALGAYDRAFEVYADALERYPEEERFHMRMAIQYARLGDEAKSAEHLEKAGRAREDIELRNRLAIVYGARGDLARAEKLFRESLAAAPERTLTRRNLAKVLSESGRAAEARELLRGLPGGAGGAPAPAGPPRG